MQFVNASHLATAFKHVTVECSQSVISATVLIIVYKRITMTNIYHNGSSHCRDCAVENLDQLSFTSFISESVSVAAMPVVDVKTTVVKNAALTQKLGIHKEPKFMLYRSGVPILYHGE